MSDTKPVILWQWRYHHLEADTEPNIEEAAASAYWLEEHGNGVAAGIEHDGRFIAPGSPEWRALIDPINERHRAQQQAERDEWNANEWTIVEIDPPGDLEQRGSQRATVAACSTSEELTAEVAKWHGIVGADRVHTRPTR